MDHTLTVYWGTKKDSLFYINSVLQLDFKWMIDNLLKIKIIFKPDEYVSDVGFFHKKESLGKEITISSTISMNNIDSVVGTALHEAAHYKYTNFKILKHLNNILLTKNINSGREMVSTLLNFIEDRRIDN